MTLRHFRAITTSCFLILALLAGQLYFIPKDSFIVPCQDYLKDTPTISAVESTVECSFVALKQKKFVDLCLFKTVAVPSLSSYETRLITYAPFSAVPEVYLDIFIPPDGRS